MASSNRVFKSLSDVNNVLLQVKIYKQKSVADDVLEAIRSLNATLFLRIGPSFYPDGTSKEMVYLWGTVATQYRGSRYNIPIEIWLKEDHPIVAPLVYVKPTSEMFISSASEIVRSDGLIVLPYLQSWTHPISNTATLLEQMSESFSQSPPLFTKGPSNLGFVSNSNGFSSLSTVSLPSSRPPASTNISTQSLSVVDNMIQRSKSCKAILVRKDILRAIQSPKGSCLQVGLYYYKDDTSKRFLVLWGTVPIQYRGNIYNIPVEICLKEDHPIVAPLVRVRPTPEAHISLTSTVVQRDGVVNLPYLQSWTYPTSDLTSLLEQMSGTFSESIPVDLNALSTSTFVSNSKGFPSLSTVSLPPSNPSPSTTTVLASTTHSAVSSTASNVVHSTNHTHRFSYRVAEPQRMLLPIQGFERRPLVSLEEAVIPLVSLVPDVEQMVWIVKQNCIRPKDDLSPDESASIMLYTIEWKPGNQSFYLILNAALRAENRDELTPWFLYLRLVITALQKLPSARCTIYRGVKLDYSNQYSRQDRIVWWHSTSCSLSVETLKNERFLGKSGMRTLFSIECDSGKNIKSHSYYRGEDEVLLLPARQFEVIGCLDQGNGLQIIQLKETQPKFPLIKLPSI